MSDQEKMREEFAAWFSYEHKPFTVHDYDKSHMEMMFIGWQASRAQADAAHKEEILRLEGRVRLGDSARNARIAELEEQLAAAQHCIEQMREEINDTLFDVSCSGSVRASIKRILTDTKPSMSALYERDAKVLEDLQGIFVQDEDLLKCWEGYEVGALDVDHKHYGKNFNARRLRVSRHIEQGIKAALLRAKSAQKKGG